VAHGVAAGLVAEVADLVDLRVLVENVASSAPGQAPSGLTVPRYPVASTPALFTLATADGHHGVVPSEPTVRPAARVLLLDDQERVLLFRGLDPAEPDIRFWFPPGGGIEAGETPEQAARREVHEETGFDDLELGPHIWNRRHVVWFNGVHTDVREVWFLSRVPAFEVDTSGFTDIERTVMPEHHWWTYDELAARADWLVPRDLARLVRDLLDNGPPARPHEVQP
jgi:8-oxo-dGTP pyrophosphatase MutT (NUDIX family)